MAGLQCTLKLYNDVYRRELATPWSDTQLAIFERGTAIGELACQRYPGGQLVGFKPWERAEALAETDRLMSDRSVPAIYEAAIEHQGVFVRVDILVRNGDGWDLVEVKASTTPDKEAFLEDVAIQHWVLTGAGLKVRRAGVLVLNREYVYPGGDYDLDELFVFGDATEYCLAEHERIGQQVAEFHGVLASEQPPGIPIGDHCFAPYDCPYYASCTAGMSFPDHPISELYRLTGKRRDRLVDMGIETIEEIPESFELTATQERMRQAVLEGRPWQSSRLGHELDEAAGPLHFLDFEAWMPALPPYPGMSPFQATPFQFSVHVESADGGLVHREYLHEENSDPRRPLAEALLEAMGDAGSIVVYSSYERTMINALAAALPDLEHDLRALNERLWDLLPVIRNHYYHPQFHGSFSIKKVLPVLVPGQDWSELEISEGQAAALAYEQALSERDSKARERIFEALRAYCAQDTHAMVGLMEKLRELAMQAR